ncbi:MAG: Gx transporter family protein [Oscillospiraceae bacterium]|jgi:heptaprenyl diphosphate synthase|nr:Gx transporter family protein [Oscillospiraceae bacterium]
MKKRLAAGRLAAFGLLVSLAIVLSYVEYLIPFFQPAPGIKPGLANVVVIFALYRLGSAQAAAVSLLRVILMAVLFGNAFALMYSLSGAVLSFGVMLLLKRAGVFSPAGVGAAGGVCHNIGQLLCALVLLETGGLIYYLPVLLLSGTAAGLVTGTVAGVLLKRIQN